MKLTVGSLFSGVGGFELGLEQTGGFRTVWQAESDEYARRVLRRRFAGYCFCDVRLVTAETVEALGLPFPDVLCGGFPCQDISTAGKGAGIEEGARSGLWREFARVIRELQPRYVLVENVPALRSRGLGRVLGDLAASGYDAEWDCIPASALGAHHRRDRLFVVAHALGQLGEGGVFSGSGAREQLARSRSRALAGGWLAEPDVGRVAHGVSSRVDRLRVLGNAVAPPVGEFIGQRILARERSRAA